MLHITSYNDYAGHGSGGSHHARLGSLQGQCTWDVVNEWH